MTKRCPSRTWHPASVAPSESPAPPAPVQDPALREILRITDARRVQFALGERVREIDGSKERLLQGLRLQ